MFGCLCVLVGSSCGRRRSLNHDAAVSHDITMRRHAGGDTQDCVLPASPALSLCYKDMNLAIASCRGRALRACLAQLHTESLIHLQQLRSSNTFSCIVLMAHQEGLLLYTKRAALEVLLSPMASALRSSCLRSHL